MNRRKRMMKDLDREMAEHIARETQDNIDRGMSPEQARHAALLKFGNPARVKEEKTAHAGQLCPCAARDARGVYDGADARIDDLCLTARPGLTRPQRPGTTVRG